MSKVMGTAQVGAQDVSGSGLPCDANNHRSRTNDTAGTRYSD